MQKKMTTGLNKRFKNDPNNRKYRTTEGSSMRVIIWGKLRNTLPGCMLVLLLLYGHNALASLIVNGDFESGNTGFSTGYNFTPDATNSCPGCLNTTEYNITADASQHHPLGLQFGDHTTGSGLFFMANGALDQELVWSQTVDNIIANTLYRLDAFISSWLSLVDPSPSFLDFQVNGVSVGTFTGNGVPGDWQNFSSVFNSSAATSLTIEIFDLNTSSGGNDFALDDISLNQVPEPLMMLLLSIGLAGFFVRQNTSIKTVRLIQIEAVQTKQALSSFCITWKKPPGLNSGEDRTRHISIQAYE